jgi:hypothetical protein
MWKKKDYKINLDEVSTLYKRKIELSTPYELKERGRLEFLTLLASTPDILICGDRRFDKMLVYYNEESWIAELETLVVSEE